MFTDWLDWFLDTKEGLIILTATTCVVVLSMAVGCVVCCLYYRLPYCPRYVGRWFQDPAQAAAARRSLDRAINSPFSWRLRRVRPRRRQVLIFYLSCRFYTSPCVFAVSSGPNVVERGSSLAVHLLVSCTSRPYICWLEINCFLDFQQQQNYFNIVRRMQDDLEMADLDELPAVSGGSPPVVPGADAAAGAAGGRPSMPPPPPPSVDPLRASIRHSSSSFSGPSSSASAGAVAGSGSIPVAPPMPPKMSSCQLQAVKPQIAAKPPPSPAPPTRRSSLRGSSSLPGSRSSSPHRSVGPAVLKLSPPVLHPADQRAKELADIRAGLRRVPQAAASAADPPMDPAVQLFSDLVAMYSKAV